MPPAKSPATPYGKPLRVWTIEHQKRYCELIRRHAAPLRSRNSITAIEFDELDYLARQRKRLGYPVSQRERLVNRQARRQIKELLKQLSRPVKLQRPRRKA